MFNEYKLTVSTIAEIHIYLKKVVPFVLEVFFSLLFQFAKIQHIK